MTANSSVQIRRARPEDASQIAALGAKVFSDSFGYSMELDDLEDYLHKSYSLSVIEAEISDSAKHFVVADLGNTVVGFSQLTEGTWDPCIANVERPVELQRLYVEQSQHGTGLAQQLVEHIESIARSRSYKVMWLGVWEDNIKAQRFYQKLGFTRIGEHSFVMGKCQQMDWILSKSL